MIPSELLKRECAVYSSLHIVDTNADINGWERARLLMRLLEGHGWEIRRVGDEK